jgi:HSP20 family protein
MNLMRLERDLPSLQGFFGTPRRNEREDEMNLAAWAPPVDITEDKDRILITAELPGFKEDQIEIQTEDGMLTLRGERKFEKETDGKSYHRVERAYGQFVRSFSLPNNVDREKIRASFHDGLLQVELPKREDARPKNIKISSGAENKKVETIDVQAKK